MPVPSEQQNQAVAEVERTTSDLSQRIDSLRAERFEAIKSRIAQQTEHRRQSRLARIEAQLGREQPSATVTTASPAKASTPKRTKDMWSNALKRAQGDDAAPAQPSGKRDGADRKALWKRAIKGQ